MSDFAFAGVAGVCGYVFTPAHTLIFSHFFCFSGLSDTRRYPQHPQNLKFRQAQDTTG